MSKHTFRLAIVHSDNPQIVDAWVQHVSNVVQKIGGGLVEIKLIEEQGTKIVTVIGDDYVQHLELIRFFGPEVIAPAQMYPLAPENMNQEWLQAAEAIMVREGLQNVRLMSNPPALAFQFLSDVLTFAKEARALTAHDGGQLKSLASSNNDQSGSRLAAESSASRSDAAMSRFITHAGTRSLN